jgi:membrane-associated phospholipid phosphatase
MSSMSESVVNDRMSVAESAPAAGAVQIAVRECRWLLVAVACQVVWSAVVCSLAGRSILAGPLDAYTTVLAAALVFGVMAGAIALFRRRLAQAPSVSTRDAYARAWGSFRGEFLDREHMATVALTLAVAPLALSAFSAAKQAIPLLHPFNWDEWITKADLALAGGVPLAQRFQFVLGRPEITAGVDWFYHRVWTALLLALFAVSAVSPSSPLRRRFVLSFVLVFFLVGNVFALVWSSAGPPYYALAVPGAENPYSELFSYLRSVQAHSPLLSVQGQSVLWSAYRQHLEGFGFGVSAMPSVHVASAMLVALFGFAQSRLLGTILSIIALCTFVSSVALGWHYPLDGYVGAALAVVIWWVAGLVSRNGHA